MKITKTPFEGLRIVQPVVFEDDRGYFCELYSRKSFHDAGITAEFFQDNQSLSVKGVIRGLHFQKPPFAQAKLVMVLSGIIQDVVVDLRKGQPTYGEHYSIELSSDNQKQLLIPKGFAHGFLVLSDIAKVLYKTDEYYNPPAERGIFFADPGLKIDWKVNTEKVIISEKDRLLPNFATGADYFV